MCLKQATALEIQNFVSKDTHILTDWVYVTGLQRDQTSQSQGNQPWILIGKTDAEALILWPPDANSQLIGKDPDAGKDWSQKKKWVAEDGMVR